MTHLLSSLFLLSGFNFLLLQVFAQQQCSSEGSVSIRSGSSTSSTAGRVEYCLRPTSGDGSLYWAVVCNSTFQLSEAHVACRTVNTTYAAYTTLPGADFSQIGLNYQVEVQCGGYESSLSDCNVTEVPSSSTCNMIASAAGLSCNTGGVENSVILVGSRSDTEGYVMIYIANSWFFLVASPNYWTDTHVGVVCRQLGYAGGVVPSSTDGYSEPANPSRYRANLECSSSARGLGECSDTKFLFASPVLLAVSCTLSDDADGTLRLSQGDLEIAFNGRYGTVCSSDFGSQEGVVVCRQFGYNASSYRSSNVFASRPHYLAGLDCSGSESSLLDCTYDSPLGTTCSSGMGVHVYCSIYLSPDDRGSGGGNMDEGLSKGAIVGIIMSIVVLIVALFLFCYFFAVNGGKIINKFNEFNTKVQDWWSGLWHQEHLVEANSAVSSEPPSSRPAVAFELQGTTLVVQEAESATEMKQPSIFSSAALPKEPQNPQLSAEAPPTYRDTEQFEEVTTKEDTGDLEKPPPYIDPLGAVPSAPPTVGGAVDAPPMVPSYPPTYVPTVCPTHPPNYSPTDPAY